MRSLHLFFGFYAFFVFQGPAVSRLGIIGEQKFVGKSVDSVGSFNRLHAWLFRFEENTSTALFNKMIREYVIISFGSNLQVAHHS